MNTLFAFVLLALVVCSLGAVLPYYGYGHGYGYGFAGYGSHVSSYSGYPGHYGYYSATY